VAALCIVLVSACTRRKPDESNRKVVGFAINTLNNPFFVDMKLGAETAASEAGIEVLIQATEREMDVEKQVHILENLIQRNVHVLCVTPNGSKEIIPAILKANARNIPFIVVDSRVDQRALKDAGGWIASFVGSDNDEGGQLAAIRDSEAFARQSQRCRHSRLSAPSWQVSIEARAIRCSRTFSWLILPSELSSRATI